jgi:uncharacterized protein (TIGR03083 family)
MYRSARERIIELVTSPGVDHQLVVPATPMWSVHDVLAHAAGVANDAVTGNMHGAPGDDWTEAQVARARSSSVSDLVAQWQADGPKLDEVFRTAEGGLATAGVIDVHTHEADLRHALGLPFQVPTDFLDWAAERLGAGFAELVAAVGLPEVDVFVSDAELFRSRLGRRTEAEVCAYQWSADPAPYLDAWFIFGRATESLGERT